MRRMPLAECLAVLRACRTERDVVVSTMGSAREWMKLGSHPLDFIYAPSSMGQAPSLGLGIALAQPERRVIVCNGDGCMLMNLGCLVTVTAEAPAKEASKEAIIRSLDAVGTAVIKDLVLRPGA